MAGKHEVEAENHELWNTLQKTKRANGRRQRAVRAELVYTDSMLALVRDARRHPDSSLVFQAKLVRYEVELLKKRASLERQVRVPCEAGEE